MNASSIRILVIDDKKIIGTMFELTLTQKGHMVVWASNVQEALFELSQHTFDIAFLDVVMPDCDGVAVLAKIKRAAPKLPVVMMSGFEQQDKRQESQMLGAAAYLKKPFELNDIRRAIKTILGKDL